MGKQQSFEKQYQRPEWMHVRAKVFERDNHKCIKCESKDNLRCHHILYVKGYMIWDYDLCIFQTLCDDCHREFHESIKGTDMVIPESKYLKYVRKRSQGKAVVSKPVPTKSKKTKKGKYEKLFNSLTNKQKELEKKRKRLLG